MFDKRRAASSPQRGPPRLRQAACRGTVNAARPPPRPAQPATGSLTITFRAAEGCWKNAPRRVRGEAWCAGRDREGGDARAYCEKPRVARHCARALAPAKYVSSADRPASRQATSIAPAPAGLPSNLLHSSGNPALRRPSKRAGIFAANDCSDLTVSLGLRRRASAKAVFASSILPSSA